MKSILFKITLVVALILSCTVAQANENKIAPKSLPVPVKAFVKTHFSNVKIVEAEFKQGMYEIELSNGYEVKLSAQGQWSSIDAPSNKMIPTKVLKKFIPKKVIDYLTQQGVQNRVEEITFEFEAGFKIDLDNAPDLLFTKAGNLK